MGDIKTHFNPHVLVQGQYSHAPGVVDPIMLRHQYKQDPQYLDPNQSFVFPAIRPSFLNETIICPLNKISCAIDRMILEVCTTAPDAPVEREGGNIAASPDVFNIPAFDDIKMNSGDSADDIDGIPRYYDTATQTYHMTNTDESGVEILTRINANLRNTSIRTGTISGFIPNPEITILPVMFVEPILSDPDDRNSGTNTSYTNKHVGASIHAGYWIRDPARSLFIGVDLTDTITPITILQTQNLLPVLPGTNTAISDPDAATYNDIVFDEQRNFVSRQITTPAVAGDDSQPERMDTIHFHIAPNYVIKVTKANLLERATTPSIVIQDAVDDADVTTALGQRDTVVVELIPRMIFRTSGTSVPGGVNPAIASNNLDGFTSGTYENKFNYGTEGFSRGVDSNNRQLTAETDTFSDLIHFVTTGVYEDATYRYIFSFTNFLLRIRLNSSLLSTTQNRIGANGTRNIMGGSNSNEIKAIPLVIRPGGQNPSLQSRGSALYAFFFGNRREVIPTHGERLGQNLPISSQHIFHLDSHLSFYPETHSVLQIIYDARRNRVSSGYHSTGRGLGSYGFRYTLQRTSSGINPNVLIIKEQYVIPPDVTTGNTIRVSSGRYEEIERANFRLFRLERINDEEIPRRLLPLFTNIEYYDSQTYVVDGIEYPLRLRINGIRPEGSSLGHIFNPQRNQDHLRIEYPTRHGNDVRLRSVAFKLSSTVFCISRMRESYRINGPFEQDGGHIGTGDRAIQHVSNYNTDFQNGYAMLPESSVVDVYPFTLGGTMTTSSGVIANPNYPTGLDFVYDRDNANNIITTFTPTKNRHGNMFIGAASVVPSSTIISDHSDVSNQFVDSTTINGETISGKVLTEQDINVYFRGPNYSLSVGYDGFAVFPTGTSSGQTSTTARLNDPGYEFYRYRQEQYVVANHGFPAISFGALTTVSTTTDLPGGVALDPPLNQVFPNDPNIRADPNNPNLVYYIFPRNVGVARINYPNYRAEANRRLLPYETMSTAITNTNISASGQPYQTCLMPLPEWFKQWGILFQNDYIRRTFPLEYKAFAWGFASEEEWKSISYGDMTMHPQDVSIFHKEREQFRKMRLFHMERMFKKMHLTLMNVPPESFTCEFQMNNINKIWYGAQDITAPSSVGTTSIDFQPISPLLPSTTASGNISYVRPAGAEASLPVAQNPDPQYKILYAPPNIPDIIYFRIRVYGHEVTEMELKMKDDIHKDLQSKKFFVDTDPVVEEFYFNASQDNINITLESVLGPVAGVMFEMSPELNYNPGNIMNRIGDALPGVYYDDLRTLAQQTTFYIGREQSPYEIVTQPAPFIYLKTGLLQGQTPFIRDLESTYARYYQSVTNAPDGFINHTTSNVTACVPVFTFSFCKDYLKGIKGYDNGSSLFKGDCSIQIQNTKELFRGIQKRLPSMPNFVPPKVESETLHPLNLNERIYSYITRGIKPLIRIQFVSHIITLFEITPYNIKKEPLRY